MFLPVKKDEQLTKFVESHEKALREIVDQLNQVISKEMERKHLVKFQRPLTREDIQFYSNQRWSEAKDVGDLIKLVPSAYFRTKEDKAFGYFKLACYEGVNNSLTFPSA